MHFWVPDVTAGTTATMAAYITTVPKVGAVTAAFRLLDEPFARVPLDVPLVVAFIAAASMTLGNLAAFTQTDLLRLLAYSTVSQVGYLFMVVAVAGRTEFASPALAVYLAGYAATNVGALAAAAAFPEATSLAAWGEAAWGRRWVVASLVVADGRPPVARPPHPICRCQPAVRIGRHRCRWVAGGDVRCPGGDDDADAHEITQLLSGWAVERADQRSGLGWAQEEHHGDAPAGGDCRSHRDRR